MHVKSCFKVEEETLGLIVYQLGEGKWSINIQVGPIVWKRTCVHVLPNKGSNITHVHVDILFISASCKHQHLSKYTLHLTLTDNTHQPSLGPLLIGHLAAASQLHIHWPYPLTLIHWPHPGPLAAASQLHTHWPHPGPLAQLHTHWPHPETLSGSTTTPHSLATPINPSLTDNTHSLATPRTLSGSITTLHSLATPIDPHSLATPRTLSGSTTTPHSLATPINPSLTDHIIHWPHPGPLVTASQLYTH